MTEREAAELKANEIYEQGRQAALVAKFLLQPLIDTFVGGVFIFIAIFIGAVVGAHNSAAAGWVTFFVLFAPIAVVLRKRRMARINSPQNPQRLKLYNP